MRVVVFLLLLPSLSIQIPRGELLNHYDNSNRSVITHKTECWMNTKPVTYLSKVKVVCAVRFEKNLAGQWDYKQLGGVVVPKDKYKEGYFPCQCSNSIVVICCPGGYCDRTLGVMKIILCGMRHVLLAQYESNNLLPESLRDEFEDLLYTEEIHGGWDDLAFLHGQDQYGNDYTNYPIEKGMDLKAIYQKYSV